MIESMIKTRARAQLGRMLWSLLAGVVSLTHGSLSAFASDSGEEWAELSLEELVATRVSLVSRKEEAVWQAPAAVHVITREDIVRSGATSIPEALRLVPGLQVSRIDANKWAISARGFNFRFANKLLVLVDGRSVYTALFSGVFWEAQDVLLEDIQQIEVIRGPGATLWGANAVNGVINIVTRNAGNTQGTAVRAGGGTQERGFLDLRYGGKVGSAGHFRVYGKYFDRDSFEDQSGTRCNDDWNGSRAGFRIDLGGSNTDHFTFQGDVLDNNINQHINLFSPTAPFAELTPADASLSALNLLGRWQRTISASNALELQMYYDGYHRTDEGLFEEERSTLDVDMQHRLAGGGRHELIWGGGYRFMRDDITGSFTLSFDPAKRNVHLFNGFVQDDIAMLGDRLRLIVGTKLEHHGFTGFELQPNARASWIPREHHVVWAAVSRAKRTPSRMDRDGRIILGHFGAEDTEDPPVFIGGVGNDDYDSETLDALEVGYRWNPASEIHVDAATFYNSYDDLQGGELGEASQNDTPAPHTVVPFLFNNAFDGTTRGLELSASWRLRPTWLLSGGYAYVDLDLDAAIGTATQTHQGFTRVSVDPLPRWRVDGYLRYVDELASMDIDSFVELDLRAAWDATPNLEVALTGQNLLDDGHVEFRPTIIQVPQGNVPRGFYFSLSWRPQ